MTNLLLQYYKGITQQLRSEVDLINSLFQHQGLKGEGNETLLRDLIAKFIPRKYGVGTGVVIDRNGKFSSQCDIVIYDKLQYSSLLMVSTMHIFPVDIVYATIEVKTTLDSSEANKSIDNIASVRKLDFLQQSFVTYQDAADDSAGPWKLRTTAPMGFVFGYNSKPIQVETFRDWFTTRKESEFQHFPAMIACLDQGILRFRLPFPELTIDDEPSKPEMKLFPLLKNNKPVYPDESDAGDLYFYQDMTYPVKKLSGKPIAIDQSRILLFFLLTLDKWLSYKILSPTIDFLHHYTTPEMQVVIDV